MSLLTWNHACSVDIRAMDDQHGILMDTMNELRLALVGGCGREQICELLDRLIEFTRMHFFSEEQLMEQTSFPGLAGHRAEHHRMLAEMLRAAHRLSTAKKCRPARCCSRYATATLNTSRDSTANTVHGCASAALSRVSGLALERKLRRGPNRRSRLGLRGQLIH